MELVDHDICLWLLLWDEDNRDSLELYQLAVELPTPKCGYPLPTIIPDGI